MINEAVSMRAASLPRDRGARRPTRVGRAGRAIACAVALLLLAPAVGQAHNSHGWYWSERKADRRVLHSYSDVESCDCIGWGPVRKRRGGTARYNHFSCSMVLDDGTGILPTLVVLGRKKARMLYNDASDIIR